MPDPALSELATAFGVDVEYLDWQGEHCTVPAATLRAVLAAMDVDAATPAACRRAVTEFRARAAERSLPPCMVVRSGETVRLPGPGVVELEDGGVRNVDGETVENLPLGYHRVVLTTGASAPLIVTPQRVELPAALARRPSWGLALQLYSVASADSWGTGDLADLRTLARRSALEYGADFVLVNPVHAGEVVSPLNPSPYLPTSRRFADPLYLHIEDIPEYAALGPDDRAAVDLLGAEVREDGGDLIDRDAVWAAKLAALQIVLGTPLSPERAGSFHAFRDRHGMPLTRFATWCVLCEEYGNDWRDWPEQLRDPDDSAVAVFAVEYASRVEFFACVQWLLEEQLTHTHQAALAAGMALGVVHDVAVGVSPAGADAWANQSMMANSIRVGAPPDAYSQLGQDWQQPPWRPDRLAAAGYAPVREMFAASLRHCGGLRVDHIIGLFRLWWIPEGRPPLEGTYVRYDHEALVGVLALEAQRAGAVVIGEDLGNVQASTRAYLVERGLLGTSILWFETDPARPGEPLPPELWRSACLASVTTHDLPPTAGYLAGEHIRLRDELGLLIRPVADERADAEAEAVRWRAELVRLGLLPSDTEADSAQFVVALHRFLTHTPALLRCVALTDVVGDRRAQNQPGTVDEYPNWRIWLTDSDGAPVLLENIFSVPGAEAILSAMR